MFPSPASYVALSSGGVSPGHSSSSSPRLIVRHPRLAIFTLALVGVGAVFRHVSTTIRNNELAQKSSPGSRFFVSVDRSGGGI
ncbi:hypothetical protein GE21DRAFT_5824 [Neurospora crassa]|uniref:Uncharacterized protein n=1 Tax=Neurospora crassa (strain ATCC 24698 / 74-OR23-1A / CBS 708.71 / DSM 1257 / FGSC 987) TaxID=367110 RepID=Q7S8B1_NEUCR|nr:hypothetical protein NCU08282 [Neurospora crassa OR74A]EAA32572.1 hypothetical protein NCU08282 [Neurospora crassa OR74A]KHE79525.1 hypothetical protein GE21DRAFT_5824 [Neurospora crassa]|eukprot:XP_961808.1 hypothetical protein NCU08282 [Neurospora crassa OR74A]